MNKPKTKQLKIGRETLRTLTTAQASRAVAAAGGVAIDETWWLSLAPGACPLTQPIYTVWFCVPKK